MTTRLEIYQGACAICGERSIVTLTDNVPIRRYLDEVWNQNGVRACLEAGQWKFATRAQRLDYDPSFTASFGYRRAFVKPEDWVLSVAVCQDEDYTQTIIQYADEIGYWFSYLDQIFVKFVSDDADFGMNLAAWPESFTKYVKHYFAGEVILRLTSDEKRTQALLGNGKPESGLVNQRKIEAKSKDAFNGPVQFPPQGAWIRSRYGRNGTGAWADMGNRNRLIG